MLARAPALHAANAPKAYSDAYKGAQFELDPATKARGKEIYESVCASCHDAGINRAPQKSMLALMTPESIHRSLTEAVMQAQAGALSATDKVAVVEVLAGRAFGAVSSGGESGAESAGGPLMCAAGVSPFDFAQPSPFAGWGLTPNASHGIDAATAGIDSKRVGNLKLKWTLAYPNALRARSQPTLAGGASFVGSHDGTVYALDLNTGCARWLFHASAEVRTGIVVATWKAGDTSAKPLVYFGDLIGNVYALDALTGSRVWRDKPDMHANATITAAPVLHDNVLYVAVSSLEEGRATSQQYACCTFRGSLVAYSAGNGEKVWQTCMTPEPRQTGVNAVGVPRFGPSGVALWNSPSIDVQRGRLYIATGDNYSSPTTELGDAIVAFDMKTGKVLWSYQALESDAWNGACDRVDKTNCPQEDGPDYDFGAGTVLATASNGHDYVPAGQKSGIVYAVDPDSGMLLWKNKVGRGGVVAGVSFGLAVQGDTVFVPISDVPDGRTYQEAARPGLYALDIRTGAYLWQSPAENMCGDRALCHPGYPGAITATPELVFAGSNDGHLRAFDTATGAVRWDYNTAREYKTVSGNVLLAFGLECNLTCH